MAKIPIYIPTYINSAAFAPARVLPRLLFFNGMLECEKYYFESGSLTTAGISQQQYSFPYFDNYNVVSGSYPTTDSKSLLFNNEAAVYGSIPNQSLYSEYWETYISLLYNPKTRLLNASAIIPLADYFDMELNDIVEFRGNYYHLRAINDYNLSNGECQIQLLGPIIPDILPSILPALQCVFDFDVTAEITTTTTTTTTTTAAPTTTTTTSTTTTSTTTTTTLAPPIGDYYYYAVASNCCEPKVEDIIGVVAVTASIGALSDGQTIGSSTYTGSTGLHCVSVKYITGSTTPLLFTIEESQQYTNIYGLNQCTSCNRDFVPTPSPGVCLDYVLINTAATITYLTCSGTPTTASVNGGSFEFCARTTPEFEYTSSKSSARLAVYCGSCGTY